MKSDWITLESLPHETLAQLWRDQLMQEDVPCQLRGCGTASTMGPFYATNVSWANPQGGIEVLVRREDVATARHILGLDHSRVGRPRRGRSSRRWVEAYWIRAIFMLWMACSAGTLVFALAQNPYVGLSATLVLLAVMLWVGRPSRATP